jgi:nicotinamidase-related amidase
MLNISNTALVVIDIQSKLWNIVHEKESLLENAVRIVKGAQVLGVPIIYTEQNPKGLGTTVPELAQLMPNLQPFYKNTFSCCKEPTFKQAIEALNRKQILICGIESHICVYQTTMDLMASGYEVNVVADVVSSRVARNRDIALSRMQSEGAKLTVVEMALYELMQTAEIPCFRDILKVVK